MTITIIESIRGVDFEEGGTAVRLTWYPKSDYVDLSVLTTNRTGPSLDFLRDIIARWDDGLGKRARAVSA